MSITVTITKNTVLNVHYYTYGSVVEFSDDDAALLVKEGLAVKHVTLSYDANGGSGEGPDAVIVLSGDKVKAAASTFTAPEGKQFASWNTEQGGTGTTVNPGEDFTVNADTVLYAQYSDVSTEPETLSVESKTAAVKTTAKKSAKSTAK